MERKIVAFVLDDAGGWAAKLDCLHRQHVRHDPPFRCASRVLDDDARSQHVGSALDCSLCDRAELPPDLEVVRVTDSWDEQSMPSGLRSAHRVARGTWARLRVDAGSIRFRAQTDPAIDVVVRAGRSQAIPPTVLHEVEPCGAVRFFVEFLGPAS